MKNIRMRNDRGAAMITLCLALFLLLCFIAFFVFDMNRLQMAQRQLNALCEAAALSGSAMLSAQDISYENASFSELQQDQVAALYYAKNTFAMGNILCAQLYDPTAGGTGAIPVSFASSAADLNNVSPGQIKVLIQLCSPLNNYQVVSPGSVSGRSIYVQAAYGFIPSLSAVGIASIPLVASSTSGLQKLLITMVFDISGSMDDDTVVTFVYRRWTMAGDTAPGANPNANGGQGQYVYQVVSNTGSSGTGQLWDSSGFNYSTESNGTALNVLPPQNLTYTGYIYKGNYTYNITAKNPFAATPPLAFDFALRSYVYWSSNNTAPATGLGFQGPFCDNDFGTPPGNCPVKYGPVQAANASINPAGITNVWSAYPSSANKWNQAPGLGYSPGYLYNSTPPATAGSNDGNVYFYDPYSMPQPYTGSAYAPYTDLVANITPVGTPQTQPLYGPVTFTPFVYTFPSSSNTYNVGNADGGSSPASYESDGQLAGATFNFSSIGTVVEAAHGNLDLDQNGNATNYNCALLGYGNNLGDATLSGGGAGIAANGFQKAYQRLAMYCSQPYATAVDGAYRFFQNLAQVSDTIFSFVSFSVAPAIAVSAGGQPNGGVYAYTRGDSNPSSLFLPSAVNASNAAYSCFVWQGVPGVINPNFWVWAPHIYNSSGSQSGVAGPAASPVGLPYSTTYNPSGPYGNTWIQVPSAGMPAGSTAGPPANANTAYAFNNWGFQMPRSIGPAWGADSQSQGSLSVPSFDCACAPGCWSTFSTSDPGGNFPTGGYNGLLHNMRPLYDTDAEEALELAIYYLNSDSGNLTRLMGANTAGIYSGPGAKKVVVCFTDGVPTDDIPPYSNYANNVVAPAANTGVTIYSIGIALNSVILSEQATFLQTLANKGVNNSKYFQVTSEANLAATFNAIGRQLAQCQR